MRVQAVTMGDPVSILRLGPIGTRNGPISQDESDVIAHFVQVENLIRGSTWAAQNCTLGPGDHEASEFPSLESFVFVAIYFRQLMHEDHLFQDACGVYLRNTASSIKRFWLRNEKRRARRVWDSECSSIPQLKVKDLFGAFVYGAWMFHSSTKTKASEQDLFREIVLKHGRERLLFALHGSLRELCNHLSSASEVIFQDYSYWASHGLAPAPAVVWHQPFFDSPGRG